MVHRPLQHPLEAQGRLGVAAILLGHALHRGLDRALQIGRQPRRIDATGPEHRLRGGVVEQGKQQMLHGHELMTCFACPLVALAYGLFEVFTEHELLRWLCRHYGGARRAYHHPIQSACTSGVREGLQGLHRAQQWVLVHPRKIIDLGNLGLGHLPAVGPAHPFATGMHMQHDLGGLLDIHGKKMLQHLDDEIHRGVVIVEQ